MSVFLRQISLFLESAGKDLPPESVIKISSKGYNQDNFSIVIKDPFGKEHGRIRAELAQDMPNMRLFEVRRIDANKGFGPLLYDLAMEVVLKWNGDGLFPDRGSVSVPATNVWRFYFDNRQDVGHKELPKQMLPPKIADECLGYYYFKHNQDQLKKHGDKIRWETADF